MDGFTNIPNEIVAEIFLYCLPISKFHRPNPRLAPILLTHVCCSWRVFARQYGPLWSGIQIFRNTVQESEADMELQKIKDQLNLWADNGGLRPLDVDISLQNVYFRTQWSSLSQRLPNSWEPALRLVLQTYAKRLRKLRLRLFSGQESLLSQLSTPLTALESLHIVNGDCHEDTDLNISLFSQAPYLRTVIIDQFYALTTSTHLPWKQLTRLAICHNEESTTLFFIGRNCPVLEELSIILNSGIGSETQRPVIFQVLSKLQIKVTSSISPLFFLPFTFPTLQDFGLFCDTRFTPPVFQWLPITTAHDHLYHLLRNLRSLTLGYQDLSSRMLLDILRFVPLLEVLVVDSILRSYIGFLDGLTYRSQEESILPKLTSFSLYVELDYFGRIRVEEEPTFPFTNTDFLDMVLSRAVPKKAEGLACLKQVYLRVEAFTETHELNVDDIAMEFKARKELENISFSFHFAEKTREVWIDFNDMAVDIEL